MMWLIYFAEIAYRLRIGFIFIFAFAAIVFILACGNEDNNYDDIYPFLKKLFITALISIFFIVFIPSRETVLLMAGVSITQDIAASDTGKKAIKVLDKKLDEMLEEK